MVFYATVHSNHHRNVIEQHMLTFYHDAAEIESTHDCIYFTKCNQRDASIASRARTIHNFIVLYVALIGQNTTLIVNQGTLSRMVQQQ